MQVITAIDSMAHSLHASHWLMQLWRKGWKRRKCEELHRATHFHHDSCFNMILWLMWSHWQARQLHGQWIGHALGLMMSMANRNWHWQRMWFCFGSPRLVEEQMLHWLEDNCQSQSANELHDPAQANSMIDSCHPTVANMIRISQIKNKTDLDPEHWFNGLSAQCVVRIRLTTCEGVQAEAHHSKWWMQKHETNSTWTSSWWCPCDQNRQALQAWSQSKWGTLWDDSSGWPSSCQARQARRWKRWNCPFNIEHLINPVQTHVHGTLTSRKAPECLTTSSSSRPQMCTCATWMHTFTTIAMGANAMHRFIPVRVGAADAHWFRCTTYLGTCLVSHSVPVAGAREWPHWQHVALAVLLTTLWCSFWLPG